MVYSKWINRKNTPIEQILNSKDVEARDTFRTFENFTGKKLAMTSRIMGFHDVSVSFLDVTRAIYTAAAVNMEQ